MVWLRDGSVGRGGRGARAGELKVSEAGMSVPWW